MFLPHDVRPAPVSDLHEPLDLIGPHRDATERSDFKDEVHQCLHQPPVQRHSFLH